MSFLGFSGLINLIFSIFLAFVVILKGPKNIRNISYAAINLSIALYSIGYFFWQMSTKVEVATFWFKILATGIILINITFLYFVFAFIEIFQKRKVLLFILSIINGIFVYLNYSLKLYTTLESRHNLVFWPIPSNIFNIYLTFWSWQCLYGLYWLLRGIKMHSARLRQQIQYITVGAVIGFFGGATNWPMWYGIKLPPYPNILISAYVSIVAYAIVRHKLLDIEVIIKKSLVFAGMFSFIFGVFAFVTMFISSVIIPGGRTNFYLSLAISIAIFILIHDPLKTFLINITDKFLFQKKYDYKQLLKTFSNEILTMVDLRQLLKHSVTTLAETVKLENCAILLRDKDTRQYEIKASYGIINRIFFNENDSFIVFLKNRGTILLSDKLSLPAKVMEAMKTLSTQLCFALMLHNELIGMLSLGKKKSDEEFTQDDIDVLSALASSEAIAIANAQLFEELSVTQQEAAQKEKLAVVGTLAAGINHEVCNPLTIAKGRSEAFLLDWKDGLLENKSKEEILDIARNMAEATITQVDRATKITTILSNFAKPSKDLKPKPTNIEDELNIAILLVGNSLKMDRIEIEKDIASDLPMVMAGDKELQHIFFNIIRNAAQAIKEKGKITIAAQRLNDKVVINISDSGPGIPQDKLSKIFEPFFTTKSPGEGTGLGLFIVRQVVEKNLGRISVDSVVGKGTTFSIEFPIIST